MIESCGFKSEPDSSGGVELANFTAPGEKGLGIASAMAVALVHVEKFGDANAVRLVAHTLRERSASCRVLGKAG